jgi:hypothetical protein
MTLFERIRNDSTWKDATVEGVEWNGRPAWRLTHPSGAVAHIYKAAGSVQVRHEGAYHAAFAAHEGLAYDQACKNPYPNIRRQKEARRAIAHFEQLSGMKMEIFP